jgi:NAD(P) transhydrogenase subunit alpha
MKIGVLRETSPGETRAAMVPETVRRFVRDGLEVLVEAGLGGGAFISDDQYAEAGANVCGDPAEICREAQIVVKINPPVTDPGRDEMAMLQSGSVFIAVLAPATSGPLPEALAARGVSSFALDAMPRITRAQSMDVLSSMATVAGYKAVLLAADALARMMPMLMTAAGTIKPAIALVIGAGVAGLQAVATAKRLGARVSAVDTRPAVAEQVESLGASFISMETSQEAEDTGGYATDLGEAFYKQQQEILAPHVAAADIVIATAMIPGRPAPILITEAMVDAMKGGAVIVDLAAITGGNCTLSRANETVTHKGVTIMAPTNLPAEVPVNASEMFSRNAATFINELLDEQQLNIDLDNEVISGTLVSHEGKVVHPAAVKALGRSEE